MSEQIQHLNSENDECSEEVGLLDLVLAVLQHKTLILLVTIAASALALIVANVLPKTYTATARIMPPQQSQSSAAVAIGALAGFGGNASSSVAQALGIKNPNDLYVGILTGRTIADRMIERFELQHVFGTPTMVGTRRALRDVSTITSGKDGLIVIEIDDKNPERAAAMANAYVEEMDRLVQSLAVTEAAQRRLFFERELGLARDRLSSAEMRLRDVQERTGLIQPGEQARAIFDAFIELRARIAAKEVEIASMRTFSTEANPALVRALQEASSLRAQLARLEKAQGTQAKGDIMVPTGKVPEVGLEYLRRARDLKYEEALFELLAKQFEIAKIDEAKDAAIIQVVDKAVPPDYKSKPKRASIVIVVGFIAAFLSIVWALLAEASRRARQRPAQAARLEAIRRHLRWR